MTKLEGALLENANFTNTDMSGVRIARLVLISAIGLPEIKATFLIDAAAENELRIEGEELSARLCSAGA